MFETEKKRCYDGIKKCDSFLKGWDIWGNRVGEAKIYSPADEAIPEKVTISFKELNRQLFDGGGNESPDYHLVIFYANAKQGFIKRLVDMQEREENAFFVA